jgi:uncharacterized protein YqeY
MSLQALIMEDIKSAMKAKDTLKLEALRAVKSALLLEQTSGNEKEFGSEDEIKLLQRLVKQRKDSAAIYISTGRNDLAEPEVKQAEIIEAYLPKQLSEQEVEAVVSKIIEENGFSGMASMGQLMGIASKQLAGQSDGKTISNIVKKLLSK